MSGTATVKWVYTIIKSFTANGSLLCRQSYRAISKRAGVDDKTVKASIQKLIENEWLDYLGEGTHLGGSYPILQVRTDSAVKFGTRPQLGVEFSSESAESSPKSAESQARKSVTTKETKNIFKPPIGNKEVGIQIEPFNGRTAGDWKIGGGYERVWEENGQRYFRLVSEAEVDAEITKEAAQYE